MNEEPIGVIVGRFQVASPHPGHRHLIDHVRARHPMTAIVLGVSPALPTSRDPLSFEHRAAMLSRLYPDATVIPLPDHPSDQEWSASLDRLIADLAGGRRVTLYGSRDSFLGAYQGDLPVCEVPELPGHSGRNLRKKAARVNQSFLRGVIHAQASRFPIPYPAVDMAVIRECREVLLGSKQTDGGMMRFIGGFVDVTDATYEAAALRELHEEASANVEVADIRYVGSATIDDWRYRGAEDCIKTALYRSTYVFGRPQAQDDIALVEWVRLDEMMGRLAPGHLPLGSLLINSLAA